MNSPRAPRSWLREAARLAEITLALALIAAAWRLFSLVVPRSWLFGALAALALGLGWLLKAAVFDAPAGGWLHRHRKQLTLSFVTVGFMLPLTVAALAHVRLGPSAQYQREHWNPKLEVMDSTGDPVLGWAPSGPPEYVGQRLNRIDAAKEHILLAGDSVMFGHGVEEPETAGHLLAERYAPRYQVLNLSVSGWSPDQYYLYLERTLPKVKPKVVVVAVFAGNDFQFTGREWNYGHSKPLFEMKDGRLQRADEKGDCIDSLSQSLLYRLLWRSRDVAVNVTRVVCNPRDLTLGETEAALRGIFDGIEELGKKYQVPVLFMLLPVNEDWGYPAGDNRIKYTSKYNDLKRLLTEGKHALYEPYLDLARTRIARSELYIDPGHYSVRGNRLLADFIAQHLDAHYGLGAP